MTKRPVAQKATDQVCPFLGVTHIWDLQCRGRYLRGALCGVPGVCRGPQARAGRYAAPTCMWPQYWHSAPKCTLLQVGKEQSQVHREMAWKKVWEFPTTSPLSVPHSGEQFRAYAVTQTLIYTTDRIHSLGLDKYAVSHVHRVVSCGVKVSSPPAHPFVPHPQSSHHPHNCAFSSVSDHGNHAVWHLFRSASFT